MAQAGTLRVSSGSAGRTASVLLPVDRMRDWVALGVIISTAWACGGNVSAGSSSGLGNIRAGSASGGLGNVSAGSTSGASGSGASTSSGSATGALGSEVPEGGYVPFVEASIEGAAGEAAGGGSSLTEQECNANAPADPVSGGASCVAVGATACGYHDCTDVSVAHLCTCAPSGWDCGHCPTCPPFVLLGQDTGIGAVCEGATTAVECDGTTMSAPEGCRAPDGFWQCGGVTAKGCSFGDGGPTDAIRIRYASLLCDTIAACADGGAPVDSLSSEPTSSCIVPVLQKLAPKMLNDDAATLRSCLVALSVTFPGSDACQSLSIESPPTPCQSLFQ